MDIDGEDSLLHKFIEALKGRGFFAGLTEGTPEWEERLMWHPPPRSQIAMTCPD